MSSANTSKARLTAIPLQPTAEAGEDIWLYKWNTGELSLLQVPETLQFDPSRSMLRVRGAADRIT